MTRQFAFKAAPGRSTHTHTLHNPLQCSAAPKVCNGRMTRRVSGVLIGEKLRGASSPTPQPNIQLLRDIFGNIRPTRSIWWGDGSQVLTPWTNADCPLFAPPERDWTVYTELWRPCCIWRRLIYFDFSHLSRHPWPSVQTLNSSVITSPWIWKV